MSKFTEIVFISDLHAGSEVGLTTVPKNAVQKKLLALYKQTIKACGSPKILVVVGDAIEGDQKKDGGRGVDAGANEQDLEAVRLIAMWGAEEVFLIAGTVYHVGVTEHEQNICNILNEKGIKTTYHRKLNLKVNNWFKVQARHFISSGGAPQTRFTAAARAKIWGILNAYSNKSDAPDLSVYAHVHYFTFSKDAYGTVITMPCWQANGSAFGDTKCDGHTDLGAIKITVGPERKDGWTCDDSNVHPAGLVSRTIKR
jgi:predicted MPP superfamily phosphohydrolase